MTREDLLATCISWTSGNLSDDELRENTDCAFTDEQLEGYLFIGGDPELMHTHAEILCDAIEASHKMPFAAFQATRREATRAELNSYDSGGDGAQAVGYRYCGGLIIERTAGWPKPVKEQFYLIIENCEYLSDDLERLERILYQWALGEGYADRVAHHNREAFLYRLNEFTTAAMELSKAWDALDTGESAGYPFDKSFEEVLDGIVKWNGAARQEGK